MPREQHAAGFLTGYLAPQGNFCIFVGYMNMSMHASLSVCMFMHVCACVYAVCVILFFDMESYFATQAILKLTAVFLPQVPKCWNYRSGQSHPASMLTICGKGPLSLCSDSITINYSKAQNLGKQSYSWL